MRSALLFLNIAPQTLDLDADDDWLLRAVTEAGIEPGRVVVEITERFGGRTGSVLKSLRRLRAQGLKLALDDVGTGNAGLEMLREVAGAPEEANARAVLLAMRRSRARPARTSSPRGRGRRPAALRADDRRRHPARGGDDDPGRPGLGRPAATVPADGATLDALAPSA